MWLRFRMGDAFPKDNVVGKWIIGLSTILNDLVLVHRHLGDVFRDDKDMPPEEIYFFRLSCAHYREAVKYIHDTSSVPEIQSFISTFDQRLRELYKEICMSCKPWKGSFVETIIKPIRDNFFHYPRINEETLTEALSAFQDKETGIQIKEDQRDDYMDYLRAFFADDISSVFVLNSLNKEGVVRSLKQLSEHMTTMINFLLEIMIFYIINLPKGIVRQEA